MHALPINITIVINPTVTPTGISAYNKIFTPVANFIFLKQNLQNRTISQIMAIITRILIIILTTNNIPADASIKNNTKKNIAIPTKNHISIPSLSESAPLTTYLLYRILHKKSIIQFCNIKEPANIS